MTPQFGAGSAGMGDEAVRVSTVMGGRDGPVGAAWTTSMATPSTGHSPFVVTARPNLPVVPLTLFVPAIALGDQRHVELTMGAAHAGVAAALIDMRMDDADGRLCLIVLAWVDPLADGEESVFENTRDATTASLKLGVAGGPWQGHLLDVDVPENEYFRRPHRR